MLDVVPDRRHLGSMDLDSKAATGRSLNRINLRLAGDTFVRIDAARACRPGSVSRNTWITEAIEEKPARERQMAIADNGWRSARG